MGNGTEMEACDSSTKTEENIERRQFSARICRLPGWIWVPVWEVGHEDPRRVLHSLEVGSSLSLVSLLYLMEPLFKWIGENAIWAVMTVVVVVVVQEFTAGVFSGNWVSLPSRGFVYFSWYSSNCSSKSVI